MALMPVRRIVIPIGLLLGAALAAAGLWFVTRDHDAARPVVLGKIVQPGAAAGYNVLLITLDTTRPDHLGCYGDAKAQTPTIDSLLDHGVRFDDAVTSVTTTLASHATILTGLYPPNHGVHDNGTYSLAPKVVTLAERLKQAGYGTAAFVSAFVLDERFGLSQGFDVYDFDADRDMPRSPVSLEYERRAHEVTHAAIRWLRARKASGESKPFLAWVHYFDAHYPYDSPMATGVHSTAQAYDAEIAFVDKNLKRLLAAVDECASRERTLIVLLSDHGESLGEHGEDFHGIFLYESTLHIALMLSNPALFKRPMRVDDRVVGTVDVVPTVLDLLGLPPMAKADGQSLLTVARDPDRAIYIETFYPRRMGCSELTGLRRHTDKYIRAPRSEYYDLRQDRAEAHNLNGKGAPAAQALASRLDDLTARWSAAGAGDSGRRRMLPDEVQKLQALGYVGSEQAAETGPAVDPKDRIKLVNRMSEVAHMIVIGDYEQGLAEAREVAAEADGWTTPTMMVAEALMKLGRIKEQEEVLARFCDEHPSAEMYFYVAHALLELKRYGECEQKLAAAETLDPQFGAVAALRGDLYMAQKRYADAAAQYERAIKVDGQRVGDEVRTKLAEAKRLGQSPAP